MRRLSMALAGLVMAWGLAACSGGDGGGGQGQEVTPQEEAADVTEAAEEAGILEWGGAEAETGTGTETDTGTETVTATETVTEAEPETAAEPVTETVPEAVAETAAEAVPEAVVETAAEAVPETVVEVTHLGTLSVNCDVPYVLDASKASDMMYMVSHFGDLVQAYGIVGSVDGNDLTAYPEKMYYGSHPAAGQGSYVSLVQVSMTDGMAPTFSVRIDFNPDYAVSAGSNWEVGSGAGKAVALVLKHTSQTEYCLLAVGYAGSLHFDTATGVTQVEGGSFKVSGSVEVGDPHDVAGTCGPSLQCCQ